MGGAQMYVRNKVIFLRKQGWKVDVITATRGEVIIEELKQFDKSMPELAFDIYLYSKKHQQNVLSQLTDWIRDDNYDEIVIESTCISECSWAEAVAKMIKAKNLCYLLQEDNEVLNRGIQKFFKFKHDRKELVGITEQSLISMFAPFSPLVKQESYWLPAYCNNVEADIDHPLLHAIDKSKYTHVIGTVSRLDKPFVIPILSEFCEYAKSCPQEKFLYLLVGGAPDNSSLESDIKRLFAQNAPNVELFMVGYLFPIPTRLLELCDVFVTSAGSGWLCQKSGVPTIAIDCNDFKPIGILNRTTNNALFRADNEPPLDFHQLMNDVLVNNRFPRKESNYESELPDFSEHMTFLENSAKTMDYYDMNSIQVESLSDRKLKWALSIIGPSNYLKLGVLKQNWKREK